MRPPGIVPPPVEPARLARPLTLDAARERLEHPAAVSDEDLLEACEQLLIWGDWVEVMKARELTKVLSPKVAEARRLQAEGRRRRGGRIIVATIIVALLTGAALGLAG